MEIFEAAISEAIKFQVLEHSFLRAEPRGNRVPERICQQQLSLPMTVQRRSYLAYNFQEQFQTRHP